eukprot:TRINITY_DN5388_c2_g1_i2.p1 TRINITY_DN5388_c2_g1~~TRINITY_DN5388_c2_g1_i2.p1  ORF type:complete len:476 (+),score=92.39 TRINITY_DN5388_c2_g1_i2:296-1723(+)
MLWQLLTACLAANVTYHDFLLNAGRKEYAVPARECVSFKVDLPREHTLQLTFDVDFKAQLMTTENSRQYDASGVMECWLSPRNLDYRGTPCLGCSVLTPNETLERQCVSNADSHEMFLEVYNPSELGGVFAYQDALTHVSTLSHECDPLGIVDSDKCGNANVPTCNTLGDGTGGVVVGRKSASSCTCFCVGDWTGPDCTVPPPCSTISMADGCNGGACKNLAPAYVGAVVFKNESFGTQGSSSALNTSAMEGLLNPLTKAPLPEQVCADDYVVDGTVKLQCKVTGALGARSTLLGELCKPVTDDCSFGRCGTGQSCSDADGNKNNKFTCTCNSPYEGSADNGAATCVLTTPSPPDDTPNRLWLGFLVGFASISCICILVLIGIHLYFERQRKALTALSSIPQSLPPAEAQVPLLSASPLVAPVDATPAPVVEKEKEPDPVPPAPPPPPQGVQELQIEKPPKEQKEEPAWLWESRK